MNGDYILWESNLSGKAVFMTTNEKVSLNSRKIAAMKRRCPATELKEEKKQEIEIQQNRAVAMTVKQLAAG